MKREPIQQTCPVRPTPTRSHRFQRVVAGAPASLPLVRDVAVEMPVSLEINGMGLSVMMATPDALEDFVVGFARAEGLLTDLTEIESVDWHAVPAGLIVRLWMRRLARDRVMTRVRARVTESACGLCGLSSLEAALRPLPRIARPLTVPAAALARACQALPERQALGRLTGATHAAALCTSDGAIELIREDVGRHNALDKLVGAALRAGVQTETRFVLMTSRLSYELVEKAVRAPFGAIAAFSAPTSLALERAASAGLPVHAMVRDGASIVPS